jgi:hypothetical protein
MEEKPERADTSDKIHPPHPTFRAHIHSGHAPTRVPLHQRWHGAWLLVATHFEHLFADETYQVWIDLVVEGEFAAVISRERRHLQVGTWAPLTN